MRRLTRPAHVTACAVTCLGLLVSGQAAATVPNAPAAQQAVPSGNLIQNPGAEAGVDGGLPFWDTTPGFVAEQYGSEFRPPIEISQQIGGGANLFAGGSESSVSSGSQVIDVSSAASSVDAGAVVAHLSAYLGGIDDEEDFADVTAAFLPATGDQPLGSILRIGPVTAADRSFQTNLLRRVGDRTLPIGTRRILVTITSTRQVGIYTDGYADNLSLTLTEQPPSVVNTNVGTVTVKGKVVKGKVQAKAPCKAGRKVSVKKGSKVLGKSRSKGNGSFNIKTKKHKKGKLTIKIRKRTVGTVVCRPLTKKVPGRH